MSRDIQMPLSIDDILIGDGRRAINDQAVRRLAASIEEIGLRHPITVRKKGEQYQLIAGRHRLEACRKLGREHVPAIIVSMSNSDARLWEIAENLHRADLNNIEKSEYIEEWRKLTAIKVSNGSTPSGGAQPTEAGIRKTAEKLGVSKDSVASASKIAGLSDETKTAAIDAGVVGVRELLEVAKAAPATQSVVVKQIAERRASKIDGDVKDRAAHAVAEMISEYVPGAAWDALKANLYAAGASNIANALTNITGEAIMDRRFK